MRPTPIAAPQSGFTPTIAPVLVYPNFVASLSRSQPGLYGSTYQVGGQYSKVSLYLNLPLRTLVITSSSKFKHVCLAISPQLTVQIFTLDNLVWLRVNRNFNSAT